MSGVVTCCDEATVERFTLSSGVLAVKELVVPTEVLEVDGCDVVGESVVVSM